MMSDEAKKKYLPKDACPTQGGTTVGYVVEFLDDDKWKPVNLYTVPDFMGVPTGGFVPGVFDTLRCGIHGYASAMALAWQFAARTERIIFEQVRLVPYRIVYDIKAWRKENEAILLCDFKENIKRITEKE